MARKNYPVREIGALEEKLGLLLEQALDRAVARPPAARKEGLMHLTRIRTAAESAVMFLDAAIVLVNFRA